MQAAPSIQKLLDELERLPGVGPKSAQRMAYWILNTDAAEALRLADAIREVKAGVHFCARCFNYAEDDLCEICQSSKRDAGIICVVSEPRDIPLIKPLGVKVTRPASGLPVGGDLEFADEVTLGRALEGRLPL